MSVSLTVNESVADGPLGESLKLGVRWQEKGDFQTTPPSCHITRDVTDRHVLCMVSK